MNGVGCSCGADNVPGSIHAPHCDSWPQSDRCDRILGIAAILEEAVDQLRDPQTQTDPVKLLVVAVNVRAESKMIMHVMRELEGDQ
jgi:hypothetical protein